ncbi:hypothetical protein HTZ77_29360 [Nonomuraea sp. SMC257]|uniref:Septum formation-related domain-containing protein n=1 Tax=Nonomuraea montanisoli TaxID=2741721 RepID=A0A7Y6M6P6_9ACTN|nr:hypothetical protein [Nonomuraea montanisoli]NUW35509.1 hypothetical protein [Nonomuraea montanisoli]
MIRSSFAALWVLLSLAGCAGQSALPGSSTRAEPTSAAAPQTPSQQSAIPGSQQFHAAELRPGDCVEPLPQTFMVTVVPCDVPHSAEFATTYVLPEGPWPGADMNRLMENGCLPRMRIKESERDAVGLWGLGPAEDDWPRYRTVYCLAVPPDGRKTTGRVVK